MAMVVLTAAMAVAGDGKEKLRAALGDPDPDNLWVYDDLYRGIALAKKTGKPLLVVFR
jgi:hypothetical protein